jgi:hypothetical protein
MTVGAKAPAEPYLELSVGVGTSRSDMVGRLLKTAVLDDHGVEPGLAFRFRALKISTKPRVDVYADAKRVGRTPVRVVADVGALAVIVP